MHGLSLGISQTRHRISAHAPSKHKTPKGTTFVCKRDQWLSKGTSTKKLRDTTGERLCSCHSRFRSRAQETRPPTRAAPPGGIAAMFKWWAHRPSRKYKSRTAKGQSRTGAVSQGALESAGAML